MLDPNIQNFQQRVNRIERTHANGGGFEAAGTLGMAYYNSLRTSRHRRTWLFPVALIALTVMAIKVGVLMTVGATSYDDRIAALRGGDLTDRIGAYVLQADPLTRELALILKGS
jgi:hypothetical protein